MQSPLLPKKEDYKRWLLQRHCNLRPPDVAPLFWAVLANFILRMRTDCYFPAHRRRNRGSGPLTFLFEGPSVTVPPPLLKNAAQSELKVTPYVQIYFMLSALRTAHSHDTVSD